MSSPTNLPRVNSFRRASSNLLLQEDPYSMTPRGGTLAELIRRSSTTNMLSWRDEEDAAGGVLEHGGHGHGHSHGGHVTPGGGPWRREGGNDDDDPGRRIEERRLSAMLNTPQMRSMRLIGRPKRYRWARYWKTYDQLKGLKRPM